MNRLPPILIVLVFLPLFAFGPISPPPPGENLDYETPPRSTFSTLELWLDTGNRPLAAYQLEVEAIAGEVRIVGIEGAEPGSVFVDPPYYDPAAMQSERIIIADFSTAASEDLLAGRFRIATIHLQIVGDVEPEFETNLTIAADADGRAIEAHLTTRPGPDG